MSILLLLTIAYALVWLAKLFSRWHSATGERWYAVLALVCMTVGTVEIFSAIIKQGT